ncbi:MAG: S41 family peptidase [Bryobacteraceae bacterium]|nr:S41 family peptidase [Bryobacteraceae bacterium]
MRICRVVLLTVSALIPASAALTVEQRLHDFQQLAALYNKYYAPANWKIEALGVNLFDLRPWYERVRAAKNDLEYLDLCVKYVASLQDGHSSFRMGSSYQIFLLVDLDLYDGKFLFENVDRRVYPVAQYPFTVGDELVSVNGKPAMEVARELIRNANYANDRASLRLAANYLLFRPQTVFPLAALEADTVTIEVRRNETGAVETYTIPWTRFGEPVLGFPSLPNLNVSSEQPVRAADREEAALDSSPAIVERRRFADGQLEETAFLGQGARTPYYAPPAGFVRRRGVGSDITYSGTYTANGLRIGLIRIPNWSQGNAAAKNALFREIEAEVAFMQANTDGLIVDVSRNNGGSCSGDTLSRFTRERIKVYQTLLLPTSSLIRTYESLLNAARQSSEPWVVEMYQYMLGAIRDAAASGTRSLTGPLPSCESFELTSGAVFARVDEYPPYRDSTGQLAGYSKPMIVLVDDLSFSQAEHFPAMFQDAKRGLVVGIRTAGLGGTVITAAAPAYGEGTIRYTSALTVRNSVVSFPGLPSAPYIENFGVIPDVQLDSMTRENLLTGFRPFVEGFTQIMVDHIRRSAP